MLGKKHNQSSNQEPPDLTPHSIVLYFYFINGFFSLNVDIVKIFINEILEYSTRFYECSIRSSVVLVNY